MQTVLDKLTSFDDFLRESTNVENFPLLKEELMKYKNMDSNSSNKFCLDGNSHEYNFVENLKLLN